MVKAIVVPVLLVAPLLFMLSAANLAVPVALVAWPFVAAYQRFCVAYGYQGVDRRDALRDSTRVFVVLVGASAALAWFVIR